MSNWKLIVIITVLVKVFLTLLVFFTNHNQNPIDVWIHWDGPHYIDIAQNGYQTSGDPANFIVFYPLYPLLIKIIGTLINQFNLAALIISWIFSILASIFLFEVMQIDFKDSKRLGLLSVWFMNIFPTAFFFQASYTESLFLTCFLASIYCFRKNKFFFSGLFGGLSSLTRVNGLILIPYFFTEVITEKINYKRIFSLGQVNLLTFSGFYIYLLINLLTFGNLFYFNKPLTEHWFKTFQWPWVGIGNLINFIPSLTGNNQYLFQGEIVAIIFTFLLSIYVLFKVRVSYGAYMLISLFVFTSTGFIMSTPRYILILFPIYIALAKLTNKFTFIPISLISIILLITLTLFYTQGNWAY